VLWPEEGYQCLHSVSPKLEFPWCPVDERNGLPTMAIRGRDVEAVHE
jgi:hypothetical protein